jgi:Zn-dependent peptidase ImmA (M78 family)
MRAKVQTGRRFEIMRLVADHIVAVSDDLLLPATTAKTDRQKFQRAFAQEFLLPSEELGEEMRSLSNSDNISDHDTEDIAQHYDVSPLLVNTVLVNRGFLPRDTLHATN